jgi:hypothetical protein
MSQTATEEQIQRRSAGEGIPVLALWYGFLIGPLAWSLHLLGGLIIVAAASTGGDFTLAGVSVWRVVLIAATAVAVLVALSGDAVAYRCWRIARPHGGSASDPPAGRSVFMAQAGIYMSALFAAGIVLVAIAILELGDW